MKDIRSQRLEQFYRCPNSQDETDDNRKDSLVDSVQRRTVGQLAAGMAERLNMSPDVLVQELLLLGILEPPIQQDELSPLVVSNEQLLADATKVELSVRRDIQNIDLAVQHIRGNHNFGENVSNILLAGVVMAAWAHDGQKRLNGSDYFTHPASVAEITHDAWMKARGDPDDQKLQRLLFMAYTHDAFEDSIPKDESFVDVDGFLVTPVLVKRIFEHFECDGGNEVAQSLLNLTKVKRGGQKLDPERYIDILKTDPDGAVVKLADIQHNLEIDPRDRKVVDPFELRRAYRRGERYAQSRFDLLEALEGEVDDVYRWTGHIITGIGPAEFGRFKLTHSLIRVPPEMMFAQKG